MFGELTDIPEGIKEGESILIVPSAPEKQCTKPDENAPWYWRESKKDHLNQELQKIQFKDVMMQESQGL